MDHCRSLLTPTTADDWVSMAVFSDGSYGVPEGIMCSYPCTTDGKGNWSIVPGLELNDFSRAKQPIVRLLDTSKIEMIIDIPEGYISYRPYIDRIEVTFDPFPDTVLDAEIIEIGQEATAATRTYPVTLLMDQPTDTQILPGMAGTAKGYLRPPDATLGILLPVTAVASDQSGKSYVWVLHPKGEPSPDDGSFAEVTAVAKKQEVTVGKLGTLGLEVQTGVSPGDWVATAGLNVLRDGDVVRLREQRAEAVP